MGKQYYSITNYIQTNKPCPICKEDHLRQPMLDCMLLRYDQDTFTYYCGYCEFTLDVSEAVHTLQQVFSAERDAARALLDRCKTHLVSLILNKSYNIIEAGNLRIEIEKFINGE